ncbi:hypothetical protein [Piscinibacter sp.]|uniref:hypothetical protein n=1 Tax=Piscinibacter sp. TaxID=1903157 RepID=UPI0039E50F76
MSEGGVLESAAFPRTLRWGAFALIGLVVVAALRARAALAGAAWSAGGIALLAGAWLLIAWLGYWLQASRTRLDGDTLSQTWLWRKQARAAEVTQLKLVHWPRLEWLVAPRLFVRQRNGSMLWFHAADAALLRGFCERVAALRASGPA